MSACGQLSLPALGRIPGAERFRGPIFHTARWDHEVDLEGKRVAVVGTGASTIQVVPAIAPQVGQLDVYQRSAPYVIPKKDRPFRSWERTLFRRFPPSAPGPALPRLAALRGLRLGLQPVQGDGPSRHEDGRPAVARPDRGPRAARRADARPRARLQAGPDLRRVLPGVRPGQRRADRPGREGADQERHRRGGRHRAPGRRDRPLDGLREHSVPRSDGDPRPRRPRPERGLERGRQRLSGHDGRRLPEPLRDVRAQHQPRLGFDRLPAREPDELHRRRGGEAAPARRLACAVRPEVAEAFDREMQERLSTSVWQTGCSNWYVDENGRNSNNWPGFTLEYRRRTRRLDPAEYEFS